MRIDLANVEFNCRVLGNGRKVIIAFHGFGQDGSYYEALLRNHQELIIYAFDLPFHGSTIVHNNDLCRITPAQVQELVEKVLQLTGVDTFSIMGFSIGVRFVFPIVEKYYQRIDQLVLLAPDGIKENIWYRLATSTSISRRLFRKILNHPRVLWRTGMFLSALRLVDKRSLRFAMRSIDTYDKREQIYHTWVALHLLRFDKVGLPQKLNEYNIKVRVFLAERDAIIHKASVKPLLRAVSNAHLTILACGHNNMITYLDSREMDII